MSKKSTNLMGAVWKRCALLAILGCLPNPKAAGHQLGLLRQGQVELPASWDYDGHEILGHIGAHVCVWDAETGKLLSHLPDAGAPIQYVELSLSSRVALASEYGSLSGDLPSPVEEAAIQVWDLQKGREMLAFRGERPGSLSPDGKQVLSWSGAFANGDDYNKQGGYKYVITVRNCALGRILIRRIVSDVPAMQSLTFSPTGRLVVAFGQMCMSVFDAKSGAEFSHVSFPLRLVAVGLKFSQDGMHYLTYGRPTAVWSLDGHLVAQLPNESEDTEAAFCGGGRRIVAVDWGGHLRVWDYGENRIISEMTGPRNSRTLQVSNNARFCVTQSGGEVCVWDLVTKREFQVGSAPESVIGFSPDSSRLLVGGRPFRVYDNLSGKLLRTLNLLPGPQWESWTLN
jgi:WD40 repeat protein